MPGKSREFESNPDCSVPSGAPHSSRLPTPDGMPREDLACALHEVGNALTVVLGWLEVARQAQNPADAEEAIRVALEHARRGRNISRRAIGDDVTTTAPRRTAAELAEFARVSVLPKASARRVELELVAGPGADASVDHDEQVLQVLTNLLLNALSFTPVASVITLTVTRLADRVLFTVQDQGPGVPFERRAALFSAPESTRLGGVGIGLPHSFDLARSSGGDLRLVPREGGACFELSWPVFCGTGVRPSAPAEPRAGLEGARVLLVDDDAAIGSLVGLTLEARGAVVQVVDSRAALEATLATCEAGQAEFELVLLDLSPVLDDLERALADLDRALPSARLVVMSGQLVTLAPHIEERLSVWVRKPFDLEQLLDVVCDQLEPPSSTDTAPPALPSSASSAPLSDASAPDTERTPG